MIDEILRRCGYTVALPPPSIPTTTKSETRVRELLDSHTSADDNNHPTLQSPSDWKTENLTPPIGGTHVAK
ncbi:hypothetical protein M0804_000841 [Polistes exclamans]|nr:hypothetical protein M0804_000841 [Polistes exclamans]